MKKPEMIAHIGTKTILVSEEPMTKLAYNDYRGWDLPSDEDGEELVYLVEYAVEEDTVPNHPNHKGYISMSPKTVLEKYYRKSENWKDRLLIEYKDLVKKTTGLASALASNSIPKDQIVVLTEQLGAMNVYLGILSKRLQ